MRQLLLTTALAGACCFYISAAAAQKAAPAPSAQKAAPAQAAPPAQEQDQGEVDAPTPVPLLVGGLVIASNPALDVEAIDIVVNFKKVTQTYRIKNGGAAELRVPASVAMPDLTASADGAEEYNIDASKPENPVGLTVTAGGAPVATRAVVRAEALGLDRLAEIKAANLPLTPFGADSDKALKALKPDQVLKLSDIGLLSPPEADQPDIPSLADWTLSVTHTWDQSLPPGKTTDIAISFTPSSAQYALTKENADALDAFKDDACLSAQTIKTLKTKLGGKTPTPMTLTEINVSTDKPMRWRPAPATNVSVEKPTPEAIVAFCGADAKTAGQPKVMGKIEDEGSELRVIIIAPTK